MARYRDIDFDEEKFYNPDNPAPLEPPLLQLIKLPEFILNTPLDSFDLTIPGIASDTDNDEYTPPQQDIATGTELLDPSQLKEMGNNTQKEPTGLITLETSPEPSLSDPELNTPSSTPSHDAPGDGPEPTRPKSLENYSLGISANITPD